MNLLDATVTKILSEPYQEYGKWWVKVEYDCWGSPSQTSIMFYTAKAANECKIGFTFLV